MDLKRRLFIKKCIEIHNTKYDYTKVEYKNLETKVIIICKTHGEFLQNPRSHLKGFGCKRCSGVYNIEDFIEKSNTIHNNKFDYTKVDYTNNGTKVIIVCPTHGDFLQEPRNHLQGIGCKRCSKIYNTEDFITKAKEVHGDKYDYSSSNYINSTTKITIICKKHGEYQQVPSCHISGQNCYKCSGSGHQLNTDEFIEKAKKIHGDKYDYSKVEYIKGTLQVIIICKEHGEFKQTPNSHTSGSNCPLCSKRGYKPTTEEFIAKAIKLHGENKYDYSFVDYINVITSIKIRCIKHDIIFDQLPGTHLIKGEKCPKCCNRQFGYTTDEFIEKAKSVHGNTYDYSLVKYVSSQSKVIIICQEHGEFEQKPSGHLGGAGCIKCSGSFSYDTDEFIKKSQHVHGDKYDYSSTTYEKASKKLTIICKKHGSFQQIPNNHLRGAGCLRCSSNRRYSFACINWLNFISIYYNITIAHAENGGEFNLPGTRKKVDGYCKENNTIYEYHGSLFHGFPSLYNSTDVSYLGVTYGELYQNTLLREELIRSKGFNLVVMWEHDWKRINKNLSILQKHFRNR